MTNTLDTALEAERWIDSLKRPTDHGVAWGHSRERPDVVAHSLYNGSAGTSQVVVDVVGWFAEQ